MQQLPDEFEYAALKILVLKTYAINQSARTGKSLEEMIWLADSFYHIIQTRF
jgi:hypothetical protein